MAYVKIIYQNSPSTATPINAENLNHMDDQIALNDQRLTEIETSYVKSFNGRKGEVTPQTGDYDMSQIAPTQGATVGQIPIVVNNGTSEDPELAFSMQDIPSSGHVIQNASGTDMAQEDNLQFPDSHVTDDSQNTATVVEIIESVTEAQWENVTEDGLYDVDIDDAEIGPASEDYVEVTADGVKTYATLLNEIASDTDFSKVIDSAYLISESIFGEKNVFVLRAHSNSSATFFHGTSESTGSKIRTYHITPNGSLYEESVGTSYSDKSTDKPSNGTKITLYYGNKSAVIDLQTTANRCLMSDGVTSVERAVTWRRFAEDNQGDVDLTGENFREIMLDISGATGDSVPRVSLIFAKGFATVKRGGYYYSSSNYVYVSVTYNGVNSLAISLQVTGATQTPYTNVYIR